MSHYDNNHGPKVVRNACDACYTRKIRCVTPQDGGPCINCRTKNLSCYFLPRYKSGRSRVGAQLSSEATSRTRGKIQSTDTTEPHAGSRIDASSDWPPNKEPSCDLELSISPMQQSRDQHDGHLQRYPQQPTPEQQHSVPEYDFWDLSQPPESLATSSGHHLGTGLGFPTTEPLQQSFDDRSIALSPGTLRQPIREPDDTCESKFLVLTQHCSMLQSLVLALRHDGLSGPSTDPLLTPGTDEVLPGHLSGMLESISASCDLMLKMCDPSSVPLFGSGPAQSQLLELGSVSLITAVVCKVLEACTICLKHQGLRAASIQGILLQKKLDLNVAQIRAVVIHLEHANQNGLMSFKELSERCGFLSQHLVDLHNEQTVQPAKQY